MTALFENIIFGPINSRRLGLSLGVNLLPQHAKICSFDCIYCECGANSERKGEPQQRKFAEKEQVEQELRKTLQQMAQEGRKLDVITFAGNGEPTLHPQFEEVIEQTLALRDELAPQAKVSVLSNATTLDNPAVVRALQRVDNAIMKIDSAVEETAQRIDRPRQKSYQVQRVICTLVALGHSIVVQTMFLRGTIEGHTVDNTTPQEIEAWVQAMRKIEPREVMIYSIDRDTPIKTLQRVPKEQLEKIAEQLRRHGIKVSVA